VTIADIGQQMMQKHAQGGCCGDAGEVVAEALGERIRA
jgi:hypothetical protein